MSGERPIGHGRAGQGTDRGGDGVDLRPPASAV
jgi:hypothetical protein